MAWEVKVTKWEQSKSTTHTFATQISCYFPCADLRVGAADERVAEDASRGLEIIASSRPILLVAHVILQDSDDGAGGRLQLGQCRRGR